MPFLPCRPVVDSVWGIFPDASRHFDHVDPLDPSAHNPSENTKKGVENRKSPSKQLGGGYFWGATTHERLLSVKKGPGFKLLG